MALAFYLGQRLVLRGCGATNEAAALLITSISFSMAGVGNCSITAMSPNDPSVTASGSTAGSGVAATLPAGTYGGKRIHGYQCKNCTDIYNEIMREHGSQADAIACLAVACVESSFTRYANPDVPQSMKLPHDAIAPGAPRGAPLSDHSVGMYQQRDSWGTAAQRLDAAGSARLFYKAYKSGGGSGSVAQRCYNTQRPADESGYIANLNAHCIPTARAIVQKLNTLRAASSGGTSISLGGWVPGHPTHTKLASQMVAIAMAEIGKPYVFGAGGSGNDRPPPSFDCSSLIQWACHEVGVKYPRDTYGQWPWCKNHHTTISVSQAMHIRGAALFHGDPARTPASPWATVSTPSRRTTLVSASSRTRRPHTVSTGRRQQKSRD